MNLSLEAYDWWATQVPTQYRTLETKTLDSSNREPFIRVDHINDENIENLFEEYIKEGVFISLLILQLRAESPNWKRWPSDLWPSRPVLIIVSYREPKKERMQWNLSVYYNEPL